MKAFKNLNLLKRSSIAQPPSQPSRPQNAKTFENASPDSPEGAVLRACRLFCESGSPNNGGEEVLHLPVIVDGAESSPAAAASAAYQIRVFLSKEWAPKPHVQYNAVMLIRILSDHPGANFTRNFDETFVGAVKRSLRKCRDASTQQILRETLDALEVSKQADPGCKALLEMWRNEKGSSYLSAMPGSQGPAAVYPHGPRSVNGGGRARGLPSPAELASRVEEARNTAKILLQLLQSTPAEELLHNELVKEFNDRSQSAQRSMQGYINCQSPQPDDDTMQTLIETNEQLSLASSRYQRAMLAARRAVGSSPSPNAFPQQQQPQPAAMQQPGQNVYSAFASAPAAPQSNGYTNGYNHAQPPSTHVNGYEGHSSYNAPPVASQPPGPTNYFPEHNIPQQQPLINPFADPRDNDHSPPLAIEPTNYGWSQQQQQQQAAPNSQLHPSHTSYPSQDSRRVSQASTSAYSTGMPSVNETPQLTSAFPQQHPPTTYQPPSSYTHPQRPRRDTLEVENAYSDTASEPRSATSFHPSPVLHSAHPSSTASTSHPPSIISPSQRTSDGYGVSPQSPPRPTVGPWHTSEIRQSYMNRQASAVDHITMHGAGAPVEIDGHSEVGRRDREPAAGAAVGSRAQTGFVVT